MRPEVSLNARQKDLVSRSSLSVPMEKTEHFSGISARVSLCIFTGGSDR